MESFIWGQQFQTGINRVDDQHKTLVELINNYGSAVMEDDLDEALLDSTLAELSAYARTHFETEERLMADSGVDPRHCRRHAGEHRTFMGDVTDLAETLDRSTTQDCRLLLDFLIHWLSFHILGIDKAMARQIETINNGVDPAAAYEQERQAADDSTQPLVAALSGLFSIVSERNKALRHLNRTLEARVAERTRDLRQANEALEVISITDHLTQLPNRRFAMRQLDLFWSEAKRYQRPLACLMIDADEFKIINDTYGHDAGDQVLVELARELQHCLRTDDIVCRMGGDEFLAICPNTDLDGALQLAERTCERVRMLKVAAGAGFWSGSVSIGAASTGATVESVDALLKAADRAVYAAKRDGRNCARSMEHA